MGRMPRSLSGSRDDTRAHESKKTAATTKAVQTRGTPRCYTSHLKVSNTPQMPSIVASQESVAEQTRVLQQAGKRVVFTNGCFDILHPGHLDLLNRARQL